MGKDEDDGPWWANLFGLNKVFEQRPETYSTTVTHEGDYMAAYLHNKKANYYDPEDIPIGGGTLEIGAKILQDVMERPGEMYVFSEHGKKKIWLTENGVYKQDVSRLIRKADSYKAGPTMAILGTPSHPKYLMWAATDETEGDDWKPVEIKSYQDLQHYLEIGHGNLKPGLFAGNYGSLGVDVFEHKPSDIWTGVANMNRITNSFALPVMDMVLDDFTGGIGSVFLQVSGLQDKIGAALDKIAIENEDISKGYTSNVTETDDHMADFISDPRLPEYFKVVREMSSNNARTYPDKENGKELNKIVSRFHEGTPMWRMKKLRKLEEANLNLTGEVQIDELKDTIGQLQAVVPEYDWTHIHDAIKTADSPADKIALVEKYGLEIQNNVMPIIQQKLLAQQERQRAEQERQRDAANLAEIQAAKKRYLVRKEKWMHHEGPKPVFKDTGEPDFLAEKLKDDKQLEDAKKWKETAKWKPEHMKRGAFDKTAQDYDYKQRYDIPIDKSVALRKKSGSTFQKKTKEDWQNVTHQMESNIINGDEAIPDFSNLING